MAACWPFEASNHVAVVVCCVQVHRKFWKPQDKQPPQHATNQFQDLRRHGWLGFHRNHYFSQVPHSNPAKGEDPESLHTLCPLASSFVTRTWHRKRSKPCGSREETSKLSYVPHYPPLSINLNTTVSAHSSSTLPQARCFPPWKQEETQAKSTKQSQADKMAKPLNFWMTKAVKPTDEEPTPKQPTRDNKLNNLKETIASKPTCKEPTLKGNVLVRNLLSKRWTKATRAIKP